MLSFSNLFQWNAAADFVADHLNYELLEPAHELVSCTSSDAICIDCFFALAENTLVADSNSGRSTWQLFRLRQFALLVAHRRWIRCLRRQRLCHARDLLHGHNSTAESLREETERGELDGMPSSSTWVPIRSRNTKSK